MTRIFTFVTALLFSALATAQVAPVERAPAIAPAQGILAHNGMVVAQERRAARIGVDILARGGNAVDAAVATGFALAVTYPRAGNLGGGGFMLIHLAQEKRDVAIDYRETAPAAATPGMFLESSAIPMPRSRATPPWRWACPAPSPASRWRMRNTAPASSRSPS